MGEFLQRLRDQATEWFTGLDKRQRNLYIGAAVVFVVLVSSVLIMITRPTYITLARGVSVSSSAGITAKLDEINIPWQVENGSTTVLVQEKDIDRARMELSTSGLMSPDEFSWDDVFSQLTFTQTTAEKNKLFLIAQTKNVESMLRTIDAIENAHVILNVKESSSFLNLEDDVSSASVTLKLKGGVELSESQVKGIVNLVTTAVMGLSEENITILDQTGDQLNMHQGDSFVGTISNQDELKVEVEKRLDRNIKDFLAQIYGAKNVDVKTSVTLDFDKQTRSTIQFTPPIDGATDGLVRSVSSLKENVISTTEGGVAGTDSNTTETPNFPTGDAGSSDYTKSQETLNYELNEVQETIIKSEGQISAISIAVLINQDVLEESTLSDTDKTELVNLVSAAAGFDNTKYVQVRASKFHIEPVIPLEEPGIRLFNIPIIYYIAAIAVFVVGGLVLFFMMKRRSESLKVAQEIIEEQEEFEEINTEFQDRSSPKYQIEKFIDSKPEAVAQLLRSWLNDD